MLETLRQSLVPINRAGWPFVAAFGVATLALFWLAQPLGWLGLIATGWCAYFFRDPVRVTPKRAGLVVAPADGRIVGVDEAVPPAELGLEEARPRVAIFLNVFDVHVNRCPASGTLSQVRYHPGRFLNAGTPKASEANERQSYRLEPAADGDSLAFVQIAGLVARRIVCHVHEDQALAVGERIGLIRFGSRMDVYLPRGVSPLVCVGQRSVAGETVIADRQADEAPREGEAA